MLEMRGNKAYARVRSTLIASARQFSFSITPKYLLPLVMLLAPVAADATRFQVKLPREHAGPVSGRLIVFAQALDGKAPPPSVDASPFDPGPVIVAAQEVASLTPGETVELDADLLAFPRRFETAPSGRYAVQVVLDRNHDYARTGRGAGDLLSAVTVLDLPTGGSLSLDTELPTIDAWTLPATAPAHVIVDTQSARPSIRSFDLHSERLSRFWGRPISMRGYVVLPPDYTPGGRRYPVVYWFHGFGGPTYNLTQSAVRFQQRMTRGKMPPMIWVIPDMTTPTGTSEFVDSVNNGPWDTAFTNELLPHIDRTYRTDARSGARFLTGHSSGGWASLHLQLAHPRLFGGTWSTSPDPVDFHAFIQADLYAPGANVYRSGDGQPLPLVRQGASVSSFETAARTEAVLGAYGGQLTSFDWTFSPRGEDGRPQPMFDRTTGAVDPAVVAYWQAHYDLAAGLARLTPADRRALHGKLHIWVGGSDSNYLDGAVRKFDVVAKAAELDAAVAIVPGRTHFDLYTENGDTFGLLDTIAAQMAASSRGTNSHR